ncbi:unnamed protein product, partial [Pleuronectes platessa]
MEVEVLFGVYLNRHRALTDIVTGILQQSSPPPPPPSAAHRDASHWLHIWMEKHGCL